MANQCNHTDQIMVTEPGKHFCEECVKTGDSWLHLRMCLTCGHVGCCDSSPNQHASRHYKNTRHPLIRSIEPGEKWTWCYLDETEAGDV